MNGTERKRFIKWLIKIMHIISIAMDRGKGKGYRVKTWSGLTWPSSCISSSALKEAFTVPCACTGNSKS